MISVKKIIALVLALVLLCAAAAADTWQAAEENLPRFRTLTELLKAAGGEKTAENRAEIETLLEEIQTANPEDYAVGRAVTDHWFKSALNSNYRRFAYRGEDKAYPLERSGLDFGGKHAFVVLGFQLENGEMQPELTGRCDAAAAAAKSFPDSILICTGGATGENNPENHTEAGEMKKYLSEKKGIDASRIFTDAEAMTTAENAVNVFRILKEQGVEAITIVTSDYHQLWAQVLFNGIAAVWKAHTGYEVRIVGNYNWRTETKQSREITGRGLGQLMSLLENGITIDP